MSLDNLTISNSRRHTPIARGVDGFVYGCMRHWLAIFLTMLLIFVSLPFLAPIAMKFGWTWLGMALYQLYSLFCHQLPQRSWFLFGDQLTYTLPEITQVAPISDPWMLRQFVGAPGMGWKVAWSDRMISFYFMVPVFGLLFATLRSLHISIRPLSWKILLILLTPLALDGVTHLLSDLIFGVSGGGFRDTNTWLAWLTAGRFPELYAGDHFGTFNWWMRLMTGIIAAWGVAFWFFPWVDRLMADERQRQSPDRA